MKLQDVCDPAFWLMASVGVWVAVSAQAVSPNTKLARAQKSPTPQSPLNPSKNPKPPETPAYGLKPQKP